MDRETLVWIVVSDCGSNFTLRFIPAMTDLYILPIVLWNISSNGRNNSFLAHPVVMALVNGVDAVPMAE